MINQFVTAFVLVLVFSFSAFGQYAIQPATSIIDENTVAFADNTTLSATTTEDYEEVTNHFDLQFIANPVFGDITIEYNLDYSADVKLEVYDSTGEKIQGLVSAHQNQGTQSILWDELVDADTYTVQLVVDKKIEKKQLVILE